MVQVTATPPYLFMEWGWVMHTDKFIFYCDYKHLSLYTRGHKGPVKAYVQRDREGSTHIYLLTLH
jgi:hypothetical protein